MRAALGACALVSLVACRTASARPDVAAVVAEPGAESRAELARIRKLLKQAGPQRLR